jgi:hypothetical protein
MAGDGWFDTVFPVGVGHWLFFVDVHLTFE